MAGNERDGTRKAGVAAAALLGWALIAPAIAPAMAQTAGTVTPPGPTPPAGPVPPERLEGGSLGSSGSSGVIRPPAGVDPGIHAPAPDPHGGTMPVIPPPGTPGGTPRVQPK